MATFLEAYEAVRSGDSAGLMSMLDADPSLIDSSSESGASLTMLAVYHGQTEIAWRLAARKQIDLSEAACLGAAGRIRELLAVSPEDVNSFSPDGFPIVGLAAFFGHEDCVRILLEAGANPDPVSKNPLGVAALHAAMSGGHTAIARMLADAGADVNAQSAEGWTPLHYCAEIGDAEMAALFLGKGADPSIRRADGQTAAEVGDEVGHAHIADVIRGFDRVRP